MTREQYIANMRPEEYIGKHELKYYNIWRVMGPAGPEERFTVYGLEKAAEYTFGTWDCEVTDVGGNQVPWHILDAYWRKRVQHVERH